MVKLAAAGTDVGSVDTMRAQVPDPVVMGVVNVTPDSFSDGGEWLDAGAAIAHGLELVDQGAQILDVGGESTRPGAEPVTEAEELRRVVPVLEGLAGCGARLSIDTSKAGVASVALDAGATIVNDVTALRGDPAMAALVADRGCDVCLMHMLGEPRTMQRHPAYADVVAEVKAFLARGSHSRSRTASPGARLAGPGDRLRQDHRPQPRAAAASGRARRARPAARGGSVAQDVSRHDHRP